MVADDGSLCPPGTDGEIRIRGEIVCRGYLDARRDAESFDDDGFLRTGDLGHLDDEGFLYITGGSRTSSSARARTSRPRRSRTSSTPTPPSRTSPSSASPIRLGASDAARSWWPEREPTSSTWRRWPTSAPPVGWLARRSPSRSSTEPSSRATRRARCSSTTCATSSADGRPRRGSGRARLIRRGGRGSGGDAEPLEAVGPDGVAPEQLVDLVVVEAGVGDQLGRHRLGVGKVESLWG